METNILYNNLIQSLRLVASMYDVQIISLPNFVNIPDEIVLIYDDVYLSILQLQEEYILPAIVTEKLVKLNQLFDEMSVDKSLWTLEKLKSDSAWETLRQLALSVLSDLNQSYEKPDLRFIHWVQ